MSANHGASSYRSWAAAVVILVTLVSGGIVPGSKLDRAVFQSMAGMANDPPMWVDGFGTRETPWNLRAPTEKEKDFAPHLPVMVRVGDDPDGIFQSSPPSPVDYAVIFSNMNRLGVRHAACGVVLAWEEADAIGLMALEKALGAFQSAVMCAPVSRGAVAQPMPQAFRRASLPISTVIGDTKRMPVINRVPVPDVLLGAEKTWAGFSSVESEPDGGHPFLCARWDDRVVFSFALCSVVKRLAVPLEAVEVRLGEYVRIGRKGPIVPIDESGRMRAKPEDLVATVEKTAEGLIDAPDGWFPPNRMEPVILVDGRRLADEEVRRFYDQLAGTVAAIAGEAGLSSPRSFHRLPGVVEWLLVEAVAFGLAALFWLRRSEATVALVMTFVLIVAIQYAGFALVSLWVPGDALWFAILVAGVAIWWPRLKLALRRVHRETAPREPD